MHSIGKIFFNLYLQNLLKKTYHKQKNIYNSRLLPQLKIASKK